MADPATKKIKIVSNQRIPAIAPWVRANLIFFPQLRGAAPDLSAATFQIADESHTIGNALRWMVMKKYASSPTVSLCLACSPAAAQKLNSVAIGKCLRPFVRPARQYGRGGPAIQVK